MATTKSKIKTLRLLPKDSHWYPSPTKKGVYYPSVTFVTGFLPKGQFFERYLADQGSYEESQRVLKEAAERGTRVHLATEMLEKGESIDYATSGLTDDEYQLTSFFVGWHTDFNPTCKAIELKLISDKHKLGGTADRVYQIDGKNVLFDLKTSKTAIHDSHWIQVAAYADMYEHLYKETIDQVAILRLTSRRKNGYEYVVRDRVEWQEDLKQFKKTYDTMMYLSGGKRIEPKIIEVPDLLSLTV